MRIWLRINNGLEKIISFGFVLLWASLATLFLSSCGQDEIELQLGEKLGGLVDSADDIQKSAKDAKGRAIKNSAAKSFEQELEKCGTDHPLSDEEREKLGKLRSSGLEEISEPPSLPPQRRQSGLNGNPGTGRLAIAIEGNLFSSRSFQELFKSGPVSLKNSLVQNKKISFTDPIGLALVKDSIAPSTPGAHPGARTPNALGPNLPPRAPILIRTDCFDLKKDEVIETDGRDIYIVTFLARIEGTIRTTPSVIEDYPGRPAGSIHILAVRADLKGANLDVSGADAGKITSTIKLSPEVKTALIAKIISERVELREVPEEFKKPRWPDNRNNDDIEDLIQAWEDKREALMPANPAGAEQQMLENSEMKKILDNRAENLMNLIAHPGITRGQREVAFANPQNKADWRKAWEKSVDLGRINFNNANLSPDIHRVLEFWIIDDRFSAQISSHFYREVLKNTGPEYFTKTRFKDLNGGEPGSVFTYALKLNPPSPPSNQKGQSAQHSDQSDWAFNENENLKITLKKFRRDIVSMVLRKMKDDKDSIGVDWYAPMRSEAPLQQTILIKASDEPTDLRVHPNDSKTLDPTGAVGIYPSNPRHITQILDSWGIQRKNYEEVFQAAEDKFLEKN